jgi:hypothetical protein
MRNNKITFLAETENSAILVVKIRRMGITYSTVMKTWLWRSLFILEIWVHVSA